MRGGRIAVSSRGLEAQLGRRFLVVCRHIHLKSQYRLTQSQSHLLFLHKFRLRYYFQSRGKYAERFCLKNPQTLFDPALEMLKGIWG